MPTFSFLPFKNLESQRLVLRQITTADVHEIFALRSNANVMKYVPRPLCKNLNDAMEIINMIEQKLIFNLVMAYKTN